MKTACWVSSSNYSASCLEPYLSQYWTDFNLINPVIRDILGSIYTWEEDGSIFGITNWAKRAMTVAEKKNGKIVPYDIASYKCVQQ